MQLGEKLLFAGEKKFNRQARHCAERNAAGRITLKFVNPSDAS